MAKAKRTQNYGQGTWNCTLCGRPALIEQTLGDGRCADCWNNHEPMCDGTGPHHGRHDCRYSGEPEAGCFTVCAECA